MSELNAKFRYIQMCRGMPTYGVTFFLVKEKLKGRNKLVPRLLGISRSSIMRIDENTKEVSGSGTVVCVCACLCVCVRACVCIMEGILDYAADGF